MTTHPNEKFLLRLDEFTFIRLVTLTVTPITLTNYEKNPLVKYGI